MKHVDYSQPIVPDNYACGTCGRTAIKLWREYMKFMPRLFCASCAARIEGIDISSIDASGQRKNELGNRTDKIGNLVPAIPDEEDEGYWGYTSVPKDGVDWWERLPQS